MNKKFFLFILLTCIAVSLFSYAIEQFAITFIDPSRNNRQILTQIFIPVDNDSRTEDESFPFIVFGHGYTTSYSNYNSVWEALVPLGWIMAFPTTEGGVFANTEQFALDLAFLSFAIPAAGENPSSLLYDLVKPISVVIAHSMGGGCSVLAASYANSFDSLVTLAAWRLFDSSPIDAAFNVYLPSLTFAGADDDFIPPENNQLLIYQNLNSIYKVYLLMDGVNHSQIYNNDDVFYLISQWLDFIVTEETDYLALFENTLESYETETILTYMIQNRYPPQNLTIAVDSGWIVLTWDKALGADYYIVEATNDLLNPFFDISTGQGSFSETEDSVSWTFLPISEQNILFFRVRVERNTDQRNSTF
ncbi:MAG: hypothetical protein K0B81_04830 [Candidatus Cloacimonetes bacterium]|nr:hypothetical protein [Candidatus Cloacimonadota bacterium]